MDQPVYPDMGRLEQDVEALSVFSDRTQPGWTRRAFSRWEEDGRRWLESQMAVLGLLMRVDAASNRIGRLEGSEPGLPVLMIGSHTDTVAGGGRFDGIAGVLAGLEVVRMLKDSRTSLRHPLEIVDFTAEEPTEFGISTVGSRGMTGQLAPEMLHRVDPDGFTLEERIRLAGGRPDRLQAEARSSGEVAAYLELHIEQGPVLDDSGSRLGVVTGIVGIHRYRVVVEGDTNHAGTTPMKWRRDALAAAAEMVLALEDLCREERGENVVGTVGKLDVEPNAANAVPGRVVFEMELRCLEESRMDSLGIRFREKAEGIGARRGVAVTVEALSRSLPIRIREEMTTVLEDICIVLGKTLRLPSGAGHDANHLARIAPIGMLFIPSKGGKSHCPEEWTSGEDLALGTKALYEAVLALDRLETGLEAGKG